MAGLGSALVLQHQAQKQLRQENQSLQQELARLAELQASHQSLSNALSQASGEAALAESQNRELLRLRGKVGLLRRQIAERAQPAAPEPSPASVSSAGPAFSTNSWPRETWTFAGYGSPESALRSAFWAATTGDAKKMKAGFSPGKQAWLSSQSDERVVARLGYLGTAKGFRIVDQQVISDDLVAVTAYLEGPDENMKMQMRRFGDEWKFDEHLGTEFPVERSGGVGVVLYQPGGNELPQVRNVIPDCRGKQPASSRVRSFWRSTEPAPPAFPCRIARP